MKFIDFKTWNEVTNTLSTFTIVSIRVQCIPKVDVLFNFTLITMISVEMRDKSRNFEEVISYVCMCGCVKWLSSSFAIVINDSKWTGLSSTQSIFDSLKCKQFGSVCHHVIFCDVILEFRLTSQSVFLFCLCENRCLNHSNISALFCYALFWIGWIP